MNQKYKKRYKRIKGTYGVVFKEKIYFVQFSLKNIWWIPSHKMHYCPDTIDANMYGWLFFYFGTMPV